MKIVMLTELHAAFVRADYCVPAVAGDRSSDVFDRIVSSMGFSQEINVPERVKNTTMSVYLRNRTLSERNTFDLKSFVISRCVLRQRSAVCKRGGLRARVASRAKQIKYNASWDLPVSKEAAQPEHAGVLAKLPAERFYTTKEWLQLRVEVIRNAKSRCGMCGASAKQVRLHVDHIKSRVAYPELAFAIKNLRVLCEACHRGRHLADAVSCC
ncbi:HNH endonuclease signature motif containing protein [Xanthobacter sp. VTT E-85241]|uniref:HNH endonuclease n=1 Tax=Roseixanthobacter finlandensis TaxID=3119922 RepID=UPI00372BC5BA